MLEKITLGQYYPGSSLIHHLDPRTKILLLIMMIVAIFCAGNLMAFLPVIIALAVMIRLSGIPAKLILRAIRPLRLILILTFILNLFFTSGGTVLLEWRFIRITAEALMRAVLYTIRLLLLVIASSMLTYTTAPIPLTDGLESLLNPLQKLRFPAHEMSMMMTIALRFIPTLLEETEKIMKAQASRGADFENGNVIQRAKAMLPILIPLFVSAFRRAGDLATAMEARCYHGGEGRTKFHVLKMKGTDWFALATGAVLIGAVILVTNLAGVLL